MFIVVLIIAMLSAMGVFAASSASVSTTAAGHERLATQTQYLTEFGVMVALSELERKGGWNVIDAAMRSAAAQGQHVNCAGDPPNSQPNPSNCWAFDRAYLEDLAGEPLTEPPVSTPPDPGSLGYADLDWDVRIELSKNDLADVAGNAIAGNQGVTVTYCDITVIARGAIWPKSTGNPDIIAAGSGSQSFMSSSAQVLCSRN